MPEMQVGGFTRIGFPETRELMILAARPSSLTISAVPRRRMLS
jgi:hypothetical protein